MRNQFFPISLNILIGKKSQFVYHFTESHSRRKGTMTEKQQSMSEQMYAGKSFTGSKISTMFTRLLEYAGSRSASATIRLDTDEHPIYRSVITRWNENPDAPVRFEHHQTSSRDQRTTRNALFAVNYFDRLIRKDVPNHRRETICYGRNDRNLLSRFVYYMVTHNFYKPFRINSKAKQMQVTHAEKALGRSNRQDVWKTRFHACRFLRSFVELPAYFEDVWFRRTPTPLNAHADPVPKFAYQ